MAELPVELTALLTVPAAGAVTVVLACGTAAISEAGTLNMLCHQPFDLVPNTRYCRFATLARTIRAPQVCVALLNSTRLCFGGGLLFVRMRDGRDCRSFCLIVQTRTHRL